MPIADQFLTDSEALLTEIYSGFNPFELPPEGAYVDCESVRGNWDVRRELGRKITRSKRPTCQLYSGHIGGGKSTELKQLQGYLEEAHYKVVYFAIDDDDIEPQDAEYADILFACTRHLVESVTLERDRNPLVKWMEERWDSLKDLAFTELAFEGLSLEQQIGQFRKISALFKAVPDRRRDIRQMINANTPSLVDALNEFIEEAERSLPEQYHRGLVVIVDNLDRIAEKREGEDKPSNYDEIFINRSEMLRGLNCHLIYTIPLALLYSIRVTQLEDMYDTTEVLPMIAVRWRDGQINPQGLGKLKELVRRRIELVHPQLSRTLEGAVNDLNSPAIFESPEALEQLCVMSGGHVRILMQLVQRAIDWTETLPITAKAVNKAIVDQQATYLQAIPDNDWKLLAETHRTSEYKRDPAHVELLRNRCLLEYSDYDEETGETIHWYDVHPLVEAIPKFQTALASLKPQTQPVQPSQKTIHRMSLPKPSSSKEQELYHKQLALLKQKNPNWAFIEDNPREHELEAILMIHKDENYTNLHGAYIVERYLTEMINKVVF